MVLAFIHARAVSDGGRCFPALVSSLLIRSDQLRRSMLGFRSASSTLAAQWSILRFVVQLSYRSSFAYVALCCAFTIKSAGRGGYRLCHTAFAAADLMAPSSRQGQCADYQRSNFNFDTQLRGNFQK